MNTAKKAPKRSARQGRATGPPRAIDTERVERPRADRAHDQGVRRDSRGEDQPKDRPRAQQTSGQEAQREPHAARRHRRASPRAASSRSGRASYSAIAERRPAGPDVALLAVGSGGRSVADHDAPGPRSSGFTPPRRTRSDEPTCAVRSAPGVPSRSAFSSHAANELAIHSLAALSVLNPLISSLRPSGHIAATFQSSPSAWRICRTGIVSVIGSVDLTCMRICVWGPRCHDRRHKG